MLKSKNELREKNESNGKRATRSGFNWITMTPTTAKPTRSQATARSRCRSQSSSRVNFSTAVMAGLSVPLSHLRMIMTTKARGSLKVSVRLTHQHERRLESVIHLELVKNIGQMGFNRFFADKYFFADFFIGQSFSNESQNLHLPLGECLNALVELAGCFQRTRLILNNFLKGFPRRDFFIDPTSAVLHYLDGLQESRGRDAFRHITAGA